MWGLASYERLRMLAEKRTGDLKRHGYERDGIGSGPRLATQGSGGKSN
jgi:hypothetical protein